MKKKMLKTGSFKKNNDDRVERLIMELEIINQESVQHNKNFKKRRRRI